MFTNKNLYTFDPADYQSSIIDKIESKNLSHIILYPHFLYDSLEVFDLSKLRTE